MHDPLTRRRERSYELLLEHPAAQTRASSARASAVERLEQALGGELTRLLLRALTCSRPRRVTV